jgi:ABC-type polysaccharide/polyol phosphate export permease
MSEVGGRRASAAPAAEPSGVTWITARGVTHGYTRGRSGRVWLVVQFALKDFKIRYTSSALGYTWSVINPLMFFGLYYVVFSVFMHFPVPNYTGFLLVSIVMWNFFAEGSANGTASLLARADILSKMVLPRQVVVYSALLSAALTFAINLVILVLVLGMTGTRLGASAVCFPLLLLDLVALTLGISLLLSPLYVRFRDIGYLWGILLQVGFWVTPIIYSEEMIPPHWRWVFWCNPLARVISDSRKALVYAQWPGMHGLVLTTVAAAVVCVVGVTVFRRLQARVVEHF